MFRLRALPPTLALVPMLVLVLAAACAAKDWPNFTTLDPAVRACLVERLGPEQIRLLESGAIPDKRKARKAAKAALMACQAEAADDIAPYGGPLFDAMSQIDETVDMERAMALVREAGTDRLALFARSRKRLHQNEDALLSLARRHPDLIVLGAPKFFQLSGDLSGSFAQATLSGIRKHGYRFVGEILYTHGDKQSGASYSSGERYVDPARPGTAALMAKLAELGVPVMIHFEPYAPERDSPRMHALFETWPRLRFIVPHMAFLSPGQATEFLSRHPNLSMTISKKSTPMSDWADPAKRAAAGSSFLDGARLRPEWRAVLTRFSGQLLAATDAHMASLWAAYPDTVAALRLVLGQLPPGAARAIAYENAEKLYGVPVR